MSPLRGSIFYSTHVPTAHAVGYCYTAPFRGSLVKYARTQLIRLVADNSRFRLEAYEDVVRVVQYLHEPRVPALFVSHIFFEKSLHARGVVRLKPCVAAKAYVTDAARLDVEIHDAYGRARITLDAARKRVCPAVAYNPQGILFPQKPDGRFARAFLAPGSQMRKERLGQNLFHQRARRLFVKIKMAACLSNYFHLSQC